MRARKLDKVQRTMPIEFKCERDLVLNGEGLGSEELLGAHPR